jgi:hypothetical protein
MVEDNVTIMPPDEIFARVVKFAEFARSFLHLPFPQLDLVNPSFAVMSKYCDLVAQVLRTNQNEGTYKALEISNILRQIADAIVDRDHQNIIDCMCHLDQVMEDTSSK